MGGIGITKPLGLSILGHEWTAVRERDLFWNRPDCYPCLMLKAGKIKYLWLLQVTADFAAVVAAYYTTLLIRFYSEWGEQFFSAVNQALGVRETGILGEELETFYVISAPRIILLTFATLVILYALHDLYPGRRFIRKRPIAWNVIVANVITVALFYTYFYLQRNTFHPRSFFAMVMVLNVFYCVTFRNLLDQILGWLRSRCGIDIHHAILLGSNGEADYISQFIAELHPNGIHIIGHFEWDESQPSEQQILKLEMMARDLKVDLIISAEKRLSVAQIMQVIEMSDRLAVPIKVLSDKLDILPNQARLPVDFIHGVPLVHFEGATGIAPPAIRILAVFISYFCMLVFLPVLGLLALLIRLTSKGPVVFVQERIGVNRKPFFMYKFRTMYDKADEMRAQVEEFSDTRGPLFKLRNDPRVTPLGRFLRRFSLDELPQFFNVARGEMMVVGPRPLPRQDFEGYYEDWHYSRHSGMPGLTCLWQVSGRSDVDFHNMCILDVYYLRNRNWILDLKIILRTVWVVLFAKGAY